MASAARAARSRRSRAPGPGRVDHPPYRGDRAHRHRACRRRRCGAAVARRRRDRLGPSSLSVEVAQPTLVAVLDRGFVATTSRWPEILPQILWRMSTRATSLAFQLAIARLPSLESRLACLLWHLADRWGHVDREGIVLRLGLSRHILADLTSFVRPSVSTALGRLKARGLVQRCGPGIYRLYGAPPDELDGLPRRSRGNRSTSLAPNAPIPES